MQDRLLARLGLHVALVGSLSETVRRVADEFHVLFASGHPGTPCDGALQALIEDFKQEFKGTDLSDLRPPDLKTGKMKTVYALADFVAGSRASTLRALAADIRADQPKRAAARKQPKRTAVTKKTDKRAKAPKRGGQ